MLTNYHTHTWRCKHAEANEENYVKRAIELGYKVLGFSDHSVYPFENGYCSSFRMFCDQLDDYVETISGLREKYKDKIEIHIGLEAEYYPKYFEALREMITGHGIEYFIMGQHFIDNEIDAHYNGNPTDREDYLKKYVDQCTEGLKTGCYTYFAHPDLFNFTGDRSVYIKYMRQLIENCKELDIPLEFNMLGYNGKRHYPNPVFWEEVGKVGGVKVIIGSDAHYPSMFNEDVNVRDHIIESLNDMGIESIEKVPLVYPGL